VAEQDLWAQVERTLVFRLHLDYVRHHFASLTVGNGLERLLQRAHRGLCTANAPTGYLPLDLTGEILYLCRASTKGWDAVTSMNLSAWTAKTRYAGGGKRKVAADAARNGSGSGGARDCWKQQRAAYRLLAAPSETAAVRKTSGGGFGGPRGGGKGRPSWRSGRGSQGRGDPGDPEMITPALMRSVFRREQASATRATTTPQASTSGNVSHTTKAKWRGETSQTPGAYEAT
jgi:hypothetical protein